MKRIEALKLTDSIVNYGINVKLNKVRIYISNYDENITKFEKVFEKDNTEILKESKETDVSINIVNGEKVTLTTNASVGFGAIKNYKKVL